MSNPPARRFVWLKRILATLGVIVLLLVVLAGGVAWSAFGGTSAIQDGRTFGAVRVVRDGFVSVGMIDLGDGHVALIDAGVDPHGAAILAELRRRGLGPDAVSAILLTHGHGDHTAGCPLFHSAAIYALGGDVALAEGREGAHSPLGRFMGVHPTGFHVTRALTDGETLTLGARRVLVLGLPGHTAGSAAYLVDGVLFLGDSAGAAKDGSLYGAPWVFSDDRAQNHASLRALDARLHTLGAPVTALVPAHTGPLEGTSALDAFARTH